MQPVTLVTMIVIMGIVWGGFAGLLMTALRKESGKMPGE
jgi:succinate-acetate transporter protein